MNNIFAMVIHRKTKSTPSPLGPISSGSGSSGSLCNSFILKSFPVYAVKKPFFEPVKDRWGIRLLL